MAFFSETETQNQDAPPVDGTPPGVRKALVGLLGVLLIAAVPYALGEEDCVELVAAPPADVAEDPTGTPAAQGHRICAGDFQVWVPGDPAPFSTHFKTDTVVPGVAHSREELRDQQEATSLGDASRAKLAVQPPVTPPVAPEPTQPTKPVKATPNPPTKPGPKTPVAPKKTEHPFKRIRVPEAWYASAKVHLVDPKGAMKPFYHALARTALRQPKAITRVAHWGDSVIVTDGLTSVLRRLIQTDFGDSGHGFVLLNGGGGYRHQDVSVRRKKTHFKTIVRVLKNNAKNRRYGFGGIAAVGHRGHKATIRTVAEGPVGQAVGRFEVYYHKGPTRGRFQVRVDGGEAQTVDARSPKDADAVLGALHDYGDDGDYGDEDAQPGRHTEHGHQTHDDGHLVEHLVHDIPFLNPLKLATLAL